MTAAVYDPCARILRKTEKKLMICQWLHNDPLTLSINRWLINDWQNTSPTDCHQLAQRTVRTIEEGKWRSSTDYCVQSRKQRCNPGNKTDLHWIHRHQCLSITNYHTHCCIIHGMSSITNYHTQVLLRVQYLTTSQHNLNHRHRVFDDMLDHVLRVNQWVDNVA